MWETENSKDAFLWEAYLAAFGYCPLNMFRNIPQPTKGKLRTHLRKNGVYIPIIPRVQIYQTLYDTCQLKSQPIWPQDELTMQIQHAEGLTSRLNAAWAREHGKQPLARTPGEPIQEIQMPIRGSQSSTTQPFLTPTTTHTAHPESRRSIRWL